MKYKEYQIEDFVKDEFFVEWIRNPNSDVKDFWTEWIASNPEQLPVIHQAKQFITSLEYASYEPLKREEYTEIFENILKNEESQKPPFFKRKYGWLFLKIAASITFVALATLFHLNYSYDQAEELELKNEITHTIKSNPRGTKSLTMLPDGTSVKLNAESSLKFNSQFGKNARVVELKGEAFFEVVPNPKLPFVIKAGEIETRVLGTSFNVRSYQGEGKTQILVLSGEVSVSDSFGNSIVLNPHEMLEYNRYKNTLKKSVCSDLKKIIAWKDGVLIFDNDPFDVVIDKLEQWYDVQIELADDFSVPGDYTGEFNNKSLERVLDGISYASGFKYSINENIILITK